MSGEHASRRRFRLPAVVQILAGLVLGLGLGTVVSVADWPAGRWFAAAVEPLGALFINAIRMCVIPLIVAKLIVGVAGSADTRALRRLGGGALALFVVILFAGAIFAAVAGAPLLDRLHIDPAVAESLRATSASASDEMRETADHLPGFSEWLVGLVPANPVEAAADGAMLPLIIFALAFGLGLTALAPASRAAAVSLFQAIGDAMIALVRWILLVAPVGVFALAVPLAARMGLGAAGALVYYVVLVAVCCTAFAVVVVYPAAVFLGRVPLGLFVKAAVPVQAIAMSSRSSFASLPVAIEEARERLKLSDEITGFFLPFAAALFRAGSVIGITIGALFIARLYGVSLDAARTMAVVATAVLATFGTPGMPSGSILVIVPVLLAAGVPVEGFGILLGVDTIPDMFRTTTNQTANLAVASILDRWTRPRPARLTATPGFDAGGPS